MTNALLLLELPMYLQRIQQRSEYDDVRIEVRSDWSWRVYAHIEVSGSYLMTVETTEILSGNRISEDFYPIVERWLEENK